jgi:hypothetical protein
MTTNILHFVLYSISLVLIVSSCKTGNSEAEKAALIELEKEVIGIHDEVMPRMTDIAGLTEKLKAEVENSALDATAQESVQMALMLLHEGDSLMWDWMHLYSKPVDVSNDSLRRYLEIEKWRITTVRTKMLESIRNAEVLLQQLGHGSPQ